MWAWLVAIALSAGCAQLAGLEETTSSNAPSDANADAGRRDAAVDSPLPCNRGEAQATDPATGACYMLFTTPAPRETARTTCLALGPNTLLASAQSAGENDLIATLAGTLAVYLGGTDAVTENVFLWADGSPVTLTNWNPMEPNNALGMGEEDCIVLHGSAAGKWDDRPCAPSALPVPGEYAFVCERD